MAVCSPFYNESPSLKCPSSNSRTDISYVVWSPEKWMEVTVKVSFLLAYIEINFRKSALAHGEQI